MTAGRCAGRGCPRRHRHSSGFCSECRHSATVDEMRLSAREWAGRFRLRARDGQRLRAVLAALEDARIGPAIETALWATGTPDPGRVRAGILRALEHLLYGWRKEGGP